MKQGTSCLSAIFGAIAVIAICYLPSLIFGVMLYVKLFEPIYEPLKAALSITLVVGNIAFIYFGLSSRGRENG